MHDIDAVVDRLVIREGIDARLSESVRLAARHGNGVVVVVYQTAEAKSKGDDQWQERLLNTRYACPRCQTSIGEIEPRTFSFNSPYGACPTCHGLGTIDGERGRRGEGGNKSEPPDLLLSRSPTLTPTPSRLLYVLIAAVRGCGPRRAHAA